jgi:hypothetical protein
MYDKGLEFRLPGTENRTKLFASWRDILKNCWDKDKGYRIWSMEEAIGHLSDPTHEPELCPCCGKK